MSIFASEHINSRRSFMVLLFVLSVAAFIFLYRCAGSYSFWTDEIYTVSSVRSSLSFSDTVNLYLHYDRQSPLYPFIAYFWYRAVPHTEQALRTLSIVFALLGCIMIGILGRRLYGTRFGEFSFLFALGNYTILSNAGIEFRPYSLVLLVSTLNYYFYLSRLKNESWANIILYGLTMSLMPYTHYVSVIFCFGLFIADCVMIARKRARMRVIASYFIGAAIFSPWGLLLAVNMGKNFLSFWPKKPAPNDVLKLARWLVGADSYLSILFVAAVLGFLCFIRHSQVCVKETDRLSAEDCFMAAGIFSSAFMVIVVYVYSAFVNPKGSFFVERYFFPIVPFALMAAAYGADILYSSLTAKRTGLMFAVLFMMILGVSFSRAAKHKWIDEPYKQTAEMIHSYEDGHTGSKSAIVTTDTIYLSHGWKELYMTQDFPPVYCLSTKYSDHDEDALKHLEAQDYDRIYLCFLHTPLEDVHDSARMTEWLYEHYKLAGQPEKVNVQILEAKR